MGRSLNFKSTGNYHKWLAFGHMHQVFEQTPGNTSIKIRGKKHRVSHK